MVSTDMSVMLAAVQAAPLDAVSRLVLADAYEYDGDPDAAAKQRLIAGLLASFRHDAPRSGVVKTIKKLFDYRKRKVRVQLATEVELHGTYWDEGSKSSYSTFDLASHQTRGLFGGPYGSATVPKFRLGDGVVVIETRFFCGKTSTMVIHVHPDDAFLLGYDDR